MGPMKIEKAIELLGWAVASTQAFNAEGKYDKDVQPRCMQAQEALDFIRELVKPLKLKVTDKRPDTDMILVEVGDLHLVFSHHPDGEPSQDVSTELSIAREHSVALDREDLFHADLAWYDPEGENVGETHEFEVKP